MHRTAAVSELERVASLLRSAACIGLARKLHVRIHAKQG
jgi:hypothetical protein